MHKNQESNPNCENCEARMPELLEGNEDIWQVFNLCSSQYRTSGMGAVIGLDYNVIFKVADILKVNVNDLFVIKLRALESKIIELISKESNERQRN